MIFRIEMATKATILLPKTNFPVLTKGVERSKLDARLAASGDFQNFYRWQKESGNINKQSYIILDGPPYANGNAHVGHAINKLLKDFILKNRVQLGYRVRFRPGWDCHGLPIELKIHRSQQQQQNPILDSDGTASVSCESGNPIWIRNSARQLASTSIRSQMDSYLRWGCTADFARPYMTMAPEYVSRQLELFAELVDKGLVHRALKPVYWSPSSHTALAESELEYCPNHQSTEVFFRFQMINFDLSSVQWIGNPVLPTRTRPIHVYLMVWTTTPWTLPMNNAIAVNPGMEYALVDFPDERKSKTIHDVYIVLGSSVERISKEMGRRIEVLGQISGAQLAGLPSGKQLHYKSAMANVLALPVVPSADVQEQVGTGLVHLSYAHGFVDYEIGRSRNEPIECFVDDRGCYTRDMGHDLCWKEVLGDGQQAALIHLKKDVVHQSAHVHSYPYDWRTNQPVIIRSCFQWFLDLTSLNKRCIDSIEGELPAKVQVSSGIHDLRHSLAMLFRNRQEWCISRQRVWGVPIPALRNCDSGEMRTNREFIRSIGQLIREKGDTDIWWKISMEELAKLKGFPFKHHPRGQVEKQNEIMDVWMDSGLAWHTLTSEEDQRGVGEEDIADLVVEGADQFRGWFNTSLLTSIALRDKVPFKRILIHGMAMDDQGKKMSKSKGNVVDPKTITDGDLSSPKNQALGADALRLWAAWFGSETPGSVSIGPQTLKQIEMRLKQIRLILRFVLGSLTSAAEAKQRSGRQLREVLMDSRRSAPVASVIPLRTLDRYILFQMDRFLDELADLSFHFRFGTFIEYYLQFLHNCVSSQYIHYLRDRLYCDPLNSPSHDAALFTLDLVGKSLISAIAPILPHLTVEYFTHHPTLKDEPTNAFRQAFEPNTGIKLMKEATIQEAIGDREELAQLMDVVRRIREGIAEEVAKNPILLEKDTTSTGHLGVSIHAPSHQLALLQTLHPSSGPSELSSDLIELLGCAFIRLDELAEAEDGLLRVRVLDPAQGDEFGRCSRCRKMNNRRRDDGREMNHCERCEMAEQMEIMEGGGTEKQRRKEVERPMAAA